MKTVLSVLFFVAGSLGLARGQDAPSRAKFGFGVSSGSLTVIANSGLVEGGDAEGPFASTRSLFYLVLRGRGLKIEPEFGLFRYTESRSHEGGYYTEKTEASVTGTRLGVGVFAVAARGATDLYYGARAGMLRESAKIEVDYQSGFDEDPDQVRVSRTNLYIGPALGVEHFFSRHFSFGGEGQILHTNYGNFEYSGEGGEDLEGEDADISVLDTRAHLFVRWYF